MCYFFGLTTRKGFDDVNKKGGRTIEALKAFLQRL
jgi:hypothetical protein